MAQRIINTEIWQRQEHRRLSPAAKLLYRYICDTCDIAGIWWVDIDKAAFDTGLPSAQQAGTLFDSAADQPVTVESAMLELAPFLIADDKPLDSPSKGATQGLTRGVFVRDFLCDQGNWPLNPENNCHRGILIRIASSNGLQEKILAHLKEIEKSRGFLAPAKPLNRGYSNSNSKSNSNKGGVGGKRKPKTAAELAADYAAKQTAATDPEDAHDAH